jgi:hypothetical protein
MVAALATKMGIDSVGLTDEDDFKLRMAPECITGSRNGNAGTEVPAHCINADAI